MEMVADRLWPAADNTVTPFDGDMDDYAHLVLERATAAVPGQGRAAKGKRETRGMTADEIRAWAAKNGWQMIGGHPSLTKPSSPNEAIVRLVLKATVAHVEAKKPAGKWEKLAGESYAKIVADPESGIPSGLSL